MSDDELRGVIGHEIGHVVAAFQKLAELDGGESRLFSSHPSSPDRAARM